MAAGEEVVARGGVAGVSASSSRASSGRPRAAPPRPSSTPSSKPPCRALPPVRPGRRYRPPPPAALVAPAPAPRALDVELDAGLEVELFGPGVARPPRPPVGEPGRRLLRLLGRSSKLVRLDLVDLLELDLFGGVELGHLLLSGGEIRLLLELDGRLGSGARRHLLDARSAAGAAPGPRGRHQGGRGLPLPEGERLERQSRGVGQDLQGVDVQGVVRAQAGRRTRPPPRARAAPGAPGALVRKRAVELAHERRRSGLRARGSVRRRWRPLTRAPRPRAGTRLAPPPPRPRSRARPSRPGGRPARAGRPLAARGGRLHPGGAGGCPTDCGRGRSRREPFAARHGSSAALPRALGRAPRREPRCWGRRPPRRAAGGAPR